MRDKFFNDKEYGYNIGWAHHWYGYFYSGYPGFFSLLLLGFAFKEFGDNKVLSFIIVAIPIGLGYIPAYRAVFTNDRYLKYFKQFEKHGGFQKQVQSYAQYFLIMSFGLTNPFFFLGLLFSFSMI